MREEWPYLVERFTTGNRYLGRLPKYVSELFSSQFKLNELQAFFDQYPDAGAGMSCALRT